MAETAFSACQKYVPSIMTKTLFILILEVFHFTYVQNCI